MAITARLSLGFAAILMLLLSPILAISPAHADTSDFSYDSWHVEYQLGVNAEGRSVTQVTETLTARFPDFDQNRGIVRGIPLDYQGTSTDPRDFSVTDQNGTPIPFEIEEDSGFVAVLTGDDSYVRGLQTYVINYTLSDTVLARDDASADEFYWDLVDFEHLQPIQEFSASIKLSPELASKLNGNTRCYTGTAGSTQQCELTLSDSGSEFIISAIPLAPREGVTVAIGLTPGAVTQPPARIPNFALDTLPIAVGGVGILSGIGAVIAAMALRRKRRTGRGTVVAQYEVPAHLPPLLAAPIAGTVVSVPAEFVHLAVSGVARIEEIQGKKKPRPALRLLDPARAGDPLDTATVDDLFPDEGPGALVKIPKHDESFGKRMEALKSLGSEAATERGYFERAASPLGRILGLITLGIGVVVLAFVIANFVTRGTDAAAIALITAIAALVLGVVGVVKHRVHTPLGAETREYLEGVKLFISVAEAERIRVLQSYEGAERVQDGSVNVVNLYEKLLPYAMMFGLEKQWGKILETHYSADPSYVPYWYPGIGVYGFSNFNDTLSQFTSSLNSAVSYTSSSSGGSTGGGFAGGGGGGGFSGGR